MRDDDGEDDVMRRALLATILICIAGLATACPPAPPPEWSRPQVVSVSVDEPVSAGSTFTVTVAAIDDEQVTAIGLEFEHPSSVALDDRRFDVHRPITCEPAAVLPAPSVTVEITCTAAPHTANGTWTVTASAGDGMAPSGYEGRGSTTMTVAGGSDDVTRPTVDAFVVEPQNVVVGEPIVVTVRASDESELYTAHPLRLSSGYVQPVSCEELSNTELSPTQIELVYVCTAPTEPGLLEALLIVRDVVGNTTTITDGVPVSAA